jgi:hypothetical protein
MPLHCRRLLTVAIVWAVAAPAYADLRLTLKRAFVEQLSRRAGRELLALLSN